MSEHSSRPDRATLKRQLKAIYSVLTSQVGVDPAVLTPLLRAIARIEDADQYDSRADQLVSTLRGLDRRLRQEAEELEGDSAHSMLPPPALRAHWELVAVLGFLGEIGIGPELLPGFVETKDGLASIAVGRPAPMFRLPPKDGPGAPGLDLHRGYLRSAAAVAVSMLMTHRCCSEEEALRQVSAELARRGKKLTPVAIEKHRDQNLYEPSMALAKERHAQILAAAEKRYQAGLELGLTEQEAAEIAAIRSDRLPPGGGAAQSSAPSAAPANAETPITRLFL
jgi:hypothetical protein